ncbi:hypothetical protein DCAR_0311331 [Daucus carota subsp. sativus]|uniref:Septum-promoting GTP-binding protein 1 n=2 Tax=Daucus carota subsp. sativus TaxID=79200 RepID=A0AAF0WLZ9_DAUCS|nr:PREDICTED: septum-promoting GTP-binding protein 1 [Daucus carota subsp. sativus]WOG92074.1 hypothetical protein DCAR_0311331 [Daucus carota subsp. sativus]
MKLKIFFMAPKYITWSVVTENVRQYSRFVWDRILVCSTGRPADYHRFNDLDYSCSSNEETPVSSASCRYDSDCDFITVKIIVLGDCRVGKTSFVAKYTDDEQLETRCLETKGLNLTDRSLLVKGARIAFTIWDVGGGKESADQVPLACKDAAAILFMFDLTSRCTLYSVVEWYGKARKWNQTALPIIVGTKFDDFIRLPPDLQWTIVIQAREYAKAMKATLFFSSAVHNINVSKIFKFLVAKLFNLPWSVERNLTPGEPVIDY